MSDTVDRKSSPPESNPSEPGVTRGHSRKRSFPTESDDEYLEERARKCRSPEVLLWCPFTDDFFNDMATTIGRQFPLTQFAEKYKCEKRDVLHALHAVVMNPLRNIQPWHEGMSVSEHAQILIANWRAPHTPSPSGLPATGSQYSPILITDDSPQSLSPSRVSGTSQAHPGNTTLDNFGGGPKDQLAAVLRHFASESPGYKMESYDSPTSSVDSSARSAPAVLGTVPPANSPDPGPNQHRDRDLIPGDSSGESIVQASFAPKVNRPKTQQKSPTDRIMCRKSADGTWIPKHKWIKGYHRPAEVGEDDFSE